MVSVVVLTCNSAAFIGETLQTVTSQTLSPAEIIIVDGGSTDETLAIAAEFNVRIAPQQSHNISNGRNIGINAAISDWVAFLDHDDLWEPTKLEKQVEAIRRFPDIRMVLTDYLTFNDHETNTKSVLGHSYQYYAAIGGREGGYFPRVDFTNQEWIIPLTSSCLIRKGLEYFDEELHGTEDIELFLRMMTYPFVVISSPLARWRISPNSVSHNELLMELDFVKTMNKIIQRPEKYPAGVYECVLRIRKEKMRHTSLNLMKEGKALASLSMFAKTFSLPVKEDPLRH
jgi:glycosyltransferase involved in cell wall biosynthesis